MANVMSFQWIWLIGGSSGGSSGRFGGHHRLENEGNIRDHRVGHRVGHRVSHRVGHRVGHRMGHQGIFYTFRKNVIFYDVLFFIPKFCKAGSWGCFGVLLGTLSVIGWLLICFESTTHPRMWIVGPPVVFLESWGTDILTDRRDTHRHTNK